jgi:hypothetical protein
MKNLKTIITLIALSLSTVFSVVATEKNPTKSNTNKELRTEIISLLGNEIPVQIQSGSLAEVAFIVNNNNEIVVLSVDSKIDNLNSFVKNKLNYKKLTTKGVKKGEFYRMPLKIKQSS